SLILIVGVIVTIAAAIIFMAMTNLIRRHAGRVGWWIKDVATLAGVFIFKGSNFVRAPHAPLQAFDVSLPTGLDVALDEGRPVEAGIKPVVSINQVAVDRLFPHGQMIFERIGNKADRLLLDAGAPAGRFF